MNSSFIDLVRWLKEHRAFLRFEPSLGRFVSTKGSGSPPAPWVDVPPATAPFATWSGPIPVLPARPGGR